MREEGFGKDSQTPCVSVPLRDKANYELKTTNSKPKTDIVRILSHKPAGDKYVAAKSDKKRACTSSISAGP